MIAAERLWCSVASRLRNTATACPTLLATSGIRGVESTLDEVGTGLVDDVDQALGVLAGVGEPQFHRVFGEEPVDRGR
ncbi:MAG: hypothetical protein M3Y73_21455 [Actinomycetota bacterium]|nr:hypothetical protein [Actinomycetota bacterium]